MQNLMLLADTINLKPGGQFTGIQGLEFGQLVGGFLNLILVLASLVFFFMLVWGGISWILSGGDKAKTESARSHITAALVGLVIVFSAWAIAQLIKTFFGGIDIFNLTIPDATKVSN